MTAKQKAAREKFKKVVAEAGKLRKKNPKLTQAQAVKQAFAMQKKVGAIKIIEKGETKSSKAKATYQQVRTKKGTFKGLKKVGGMNRTIKLDKAKRIASDWHDGQRSALYQFASSGIIVPENYNDYQDEIQKNINIAKTNKDINELHQLSQYLYYTNLKMNKNVGVIKKKAAPKKVASKRITDIHKDSKSHNVNIRVVSGIDSIVSKTMKDISETKKIILEQSELLERLQQSYKRMKNKENKELLMMDIKTLKNNFIPHNKRYLKQLQISLKKSI